MPTTTTFADELKATNYASSPKSGSGYAATDLIQLYANDSTPNGKISRTDLMSCVKDSLGSLLNAAEADQSTNAAKVPTLNASGVLGSSTIANLKAALMGGVPVNGIEDGIFIMTHRKSDNYPIMYKPHKWTEQQAAGEVADGVVVVEGGKLLVVAPTESASKLNWSSAAVSGGGVTTSDRVTAYNDFAGKANTAAQIGHAECSGVGYAPGFCANYSRVNANGQGLTTGKWWLPSSGEMMMIYANMTKINYALSLINGATQLREDAYWTSTERSATNAWSLYLLNGTMYGDAKASNTLRVRPVSAFIS